uniref:DNA-binding protein n=1 Tax=Muribaculaceae bacterium Z82 TaxID=2304548 RepID=A0A7C9JRW9_9BACT
MLSVAQSAAMLSVSPARVRALIASGGLPAVKVGRAWCLREEDVLDRLERQPKAGRPSLRGPSDRATGAAEADAVATMVEAEGPAADSYGSSAGVGDVPVASDMSDPHELYLACRECFRFLPDANLIRAAASKEEASFYMAVADFFLQQKQARLIAEGVY